MSLNDTTQKLDTQLDTACKKLEKICFDTGSTELVFNDEATGKSRKRSNLYFANVSLKRRELSRVHQELHLERPRLQHQALPPRAHRHLPEGKPPRPAN